MKLLNKENECSNYIKFEKNDTNRQGYFSTSMSPKIKKRKSKKEFNKELSIFHPSPQKSKTNVKNNNINYQCEAVKNFLYYFPHNNIESIINESEKSSHKFHSKRMLSFKFKNSVSKLKITKDMVSQFQSPIRKKN